VVLQQHDADAQPDSGEPAASRLRLDRLDQAPGYAAATRRRDHRQPTEVQIAPSCSAMMACRSLRGRSGVYLDDGRPVSGAVPQSVAHRPDLDAGC
jgi:hypothetical protein